MGGEESIHDPRRVIGVRRVDQKKWEFGIDGCGPTQGRVRSQVKYPGQVSGPAVVAVQVTVLVGPCRV